jgi:hypothetical protein
MELDLDLQQFRLPDQPARFDVDVAAGVRLAVRLPTGTDQRRWCRDAASEHAPELSMARELVLTVNGTALADGAQLAPEWLERWRRR